MGQTTSFKKSLIKKKVLILGEVRDGGEARYIHGELRLGTFTFLGDTTRRIISIGGRPSDRSRLYPNSPAYRLILNNILFPAAKKKEQKT